MSENKVKCDNCGGTQMKTGKLTGIAALQSLNSKTGLGGSDILIDFCAKCGKVTSMSVENPDAIK